MECRICLEDENQHDMISPCFCRGTSKYVHRECLNRWIETNLNNEASTQCQECHFKYKKDAKKIKCEMFFKALKNGKLFFFMANQLFALLGYIILNQLYDFTYEIDKGFFYINNFFLAGLFLNFIEMGIIIYLYCSIKNWRTFNITFSEEKKTPLYYLFLLSLVSIPFVPTIFISLNFIILGKLFYYYYEGLIEIKKSGNSIKSIDDDRIQLLYSLSQTQNNIV